MNQVVKPRFPHIAALAVALCLLLPALSAISLAQASEGWICPPCGHADDDRVYEQAGTCPLCGMELRPVSEQREQEPREETTVAILIFDGVQIIDFAAPWEVLGQARFSIYTVSPSGQPITTTMGMRVTPDHGFGDAPQPDILLVPGGHIHDLQQDTLDWIQRTAENADYVLSVCNGAFLLADAGLLRGKTATTFYGLLDSFERSYPDIQVLREARFADNGKVLTSAGLSSGIDASLHLISKIQGMDRARALALHLEYQWDPDSTYARGALADRHLPSVDIELPDGAELRQLTALGDLDSWEVRWAVEPRIEPRAIVDSFAKALDGVKGWTLRGEPGPHGIGWNVATREHGIWHADLSVSESEGDQVVTAKLERAP